MTKTKLALLAGLSLIAINANAYTGHGYTVLSETVKATPGTNGGHIDVTSQKKRLSPMFTGLIATVEPQTQSLSKPKRLTGYHEVYIQNTHGYPANYTYQLTLWSGVYEYQVTRTVAINPGGCFLDAESSYIDNAVRFNLGEYNLNVETSVSGGDCDAVTRSAKLTIVK